MSKNATIIMVVLLVIGGITGYLFLNTDESSDSSVSQTEQDSQDPVQTKPTEAQPAEVASSAGQFVDYTEEVLAETSDKNQVLFFSAAWCIECRGVERNIKAGTIPEDLVIIKVDYDTEDELKKKHGVVTQTTFVQIDESGDQITKWQGFGSDDIDVIVDNLKQT